MRLKPALLSLFAVVATPGFAAADYRGQSSQGPAASAERSRSFSVRPRGGSGWGGRGYDGDRPYQRRWGWGARPYEEDRPVYQPRGYRATPSFDYRGGQ